jgi:hypothetical protein
MNKWIPLATFGGLALIGGLGGALLAAHRKLRDVRDENFHLMNSRNYLDKTNTRLIKEHAETAHALKVCERRKMMMEHVLDTLNQSCSYQGPSKLSKDIAKGYFESKMSGLHFEETTEVLNKIISLDVETHKLYFDKISKKTDGNPLLMAERILIDSLFTLGGWGYKDVLVVGGLDHIDNRHLQIILSRMEQKNLAIMMKYYFKHEFNEKIYDNLSKRLSAIIQEDIDYMGSQSMDVRSEVHNEFVTICFDLWANGDIHLWPQHGI